MPIDFNIDGTKKKSKDIFVGVDGEKRRVVKVYAGDSNNQAHLVYFYNSNPYLHNGALLGIGGNNQLAYTEDGKTIGSYIAVVPSSGSTKGWYLYKVGNYYVNVYGGYSTTYKISVSNDSKNWTTYDAPTSFDAYNVFEYGVGNNELKAFEFNGNLCSLLADTTNKVMNLLKITPSGNFSSVATNLPTTLFGDKKPYIQGAISNNGTPTIIVLDKNNDVYTSTNGTTFTKKTTLDSKLGLLGTNYVSYNSDKSKMICGSTSSYNHAKFEFVNNNLVVTKMETETLSSYNARMLFCGKDIITIKNALYSNLQGTRIYLNETLVAQSTYGSGQVFYNDGEDTIYMSGGNYRSGSLYQFVMTYNLATKEFSTIGSSPLHGAVSVV